MLLVGAGGIGQPCALALRDVECDLRVVDDDRVESSNLPRLPCATAADVGRAKLDVLADALRAAGRTRDSFVHGRFTPDTAAALLDGVHVVVDASDNYATKMLVADAAGLAGARSVHAGAVGWLGTVMAVEPGTSACYRCLFEDVPGGDAVDCATAGVHGAVTALVGALMARAVASLLAGASGTTGRVAQYDGWRGTFRRVTVARRADCPLCGTRTIRSLDHDRYIAPACASPPGDLP